MRITTAITTLALLVLAPAATAATEFDDAGDLPATSQDLAGEMVDRIDGNFDDGLDVDIYRLCLEGSGTFSASTVGGAAIDTQLFLFDSGGRGVYGNDDAAGSKQSLLPAGHALTPSARGEYLLAVSPFNRDPANAGGELFPDSGDVFAPTGPGGSQPLQRWSGRPGFSGEYSIFLTGAGCRPPDTTAPAIDLRSPADGVEVTRGDRVVVDFSCADEPGGSGLASCVGSVADGGLLDTSTAGPVSVTVAARDMAGNARTVTHTVSVVAPDTTAPAIDLRSPADGVEVTRGDRVVVDFSCADEPGGSGLASCEGSVADGGLLDTSATGPASVTVTARDRAGNSRTVTHTVTVRDTTAPRIDIRSPLDGGTYLLGQPLAADFGCADEAGGSGLASCVGSVADGASIDTGSVGAKSFTVRASDAAGNTSTATSSYRVVYDFEGFLWPVANRPEVNRWKAGVPVPIRFELGGNQGLDVIADGWPRVAQVECGSGAELETGEPARARWHRELVYRKRKQRYVFLWQTERAWAGSCVQFMLKLDDGTVKRADFEFMRRGRGHWD